MLFFENRTGNKPVERLNWPARKDFGWRRVNRRNPCPVCQHTEWCEVSEDGLTVHCMRVAGDKEIDWRGGGWLHFLGQSSSLGIQATAADLRPSVPSPQSSVLEKATLADEETRAAAIEWLLGRLGLSREHQEYLKGEDLHDRAMELGYRTLPGGFGARRELLDELEKQFGREVARGLGFVYERTAKSGGRYLEFAGVLREVDALLLPVRNAVGRPIALKARSVQPESGERLYRAMSAGSTDLGASVGTPVHVARPTQVLPGLEGWVIITEGEKKADYAARRLGVITLGVQGVSNWRAGRLLNLLGELGVHTVVEAFDADREQLGRGKDNIERQARQMAEQCAGAGYRVFGARWALADGKGLDDLLRNQVELKWPDLHRFKPVGAESRQVGPEQGDFEKRYGLSRERAGRIAGQFVELDSETVETMHRLHAGQDSAKDQPHSTLKEARQQLARLFGGTFAEHITSKGEQSRRVLVRTTTGTGKTTAAQHAIIEHLALGRAGRILYLTDTKQAYAGLFEPGGAMQAELWGGNIAIREGRTDAPGPYHCERYQECQELGTNRQPASADVCGSCPFGSAANWKRYAAEYGFDPEQPRHFECDKSGYLSSVKRCKEAQVVVGPKAALLTASDELSEFDFIIIDEDCTSFLLERQELATGQVREWEEGRRRLEFEALQGASSPTPNARSYRPGSEEEEPTKNFGELTAEHAPFDKLFSLITAALSDYDAAISSSLIPHPSSLSPRSRFLPVVRARAEAVGLDLGGLVSDCMAVFPSRKFKRYNWEKPYRVAGRMVAPLRFARDLIEQLAAELERAEGGDTRLWVERKGEGAAIQVYLPRRNLINALGGKAGSYNNHFRKPPTVFYLDATAGPVFRLAVPGVDEIEIKVPQPLYVVQTTNSLYTGRSLEQGSGLAKIGRAVAAVAQRLECREVAVFSRKAFNPDYVKLGESGLKVDWPGVRYGHFERHNKGLNEYAGADLLAIVGHYSQPLDELQAQVEALRNRQVSPEPEQMGGAWRLRAYDWRGSDGKGLARWCKSHPDEDVQAAIEHSAKANLWQTIGRGRAALRENGKPLVVVIFTSLPVPGLPIDELTDVNDLLEEGRITERQRAALDAGREEANAARHAEAVERITAAKEALAAVDEKFVPAGRFAQVADVSRGTLRKLGYHWRGRWVRVADIRETVSLEVFISLRTKPAYRRLE